MPEEVSHVSILPAAAEMFLSRQNQLNVIKEGVVKGSLLMS